MSNGTEFHGRGTAPAHPGRHRLGGMDSWTPPLPANRAGRRHAAPVDPPVSGSLPLPLPQPRDRRLPAPLFPASRGSLPLDEPVEPPPESRADQAARRTRVSLGTPPPRRDDPEDDDVHIYAAPPIDGLGGFTIGSVPASVTPPKTWRKAAWFATGASGAVVVGLLFAGSYLVGKPTSDQAVQGAWPGYQGAPTVIEPTGDPTSTSTRHAGAAAAPDSSAPVPEQAAGQTNGGGAGPVDGFAPPPPVASTGGPGTTDTATTSRPPQKPPVTPAPRETTAWAPWYYSFPPDPQTMGDNTEKFFNNVTTDPATASSVTTGRLHDQGSQALAERYAGIAYFEVKKISIDQQRGVTVSTVEVTHNDGSKTMEQRTLTFGDGDKISADGQ